jgi:hypothetical protein
MRSPRHRAGGLDVKIMTAIKGPISEGTYLPVRDHLVCSERVDFEVKGFGQQNSMAWNGKKLQLIPESGQWWEGSAGLERLETRLRPIFRHGSCGSRLPRVEAGDGLADLSGNFGQRSFQASNHCRDRCV